MSTNKVDYETLESCINTIRQAVALVDEAKQQTRANQSREAKKHRKRKADLQKKVGFEANTENAQVAALPSAGDVSQQKRKKQRSNLAKMEVILPMRFQAQASSKKGKKSHTGVLFHATEKSRGRSINYEVDIRAGQADQNLSTHELLEWGEDVKSYKSLAAYFRTEFNQKSGNLYAAVTLDNGLTLDQCRKQRVKFRREVQINNAAELEPIQNIESTIMQDAEGTPIDAIASPTEEAQDQETVNSELQSEGETTINPETIDPTVELQKQSSETIEIESIPIESK